MKIWSGYGSEHSMNLIMIGHFKSSEDSKKTMRLIEKLTEGLREIIDVGTQGDRYDDDVMNLLKQNKCYHLSPNELEQFLYNVSTQIEINKIILRTDEFEVSAFFKLMIENGARVELFSAHDYPLSE